MEFSAFLNAMTWAFCVICPLCWIAIRYDVHRTSAWPPALKRLFLGVIVAVFVGATLYAAEVPSPDYCEMLRQNGWTWWELLFLGCV